MEIEDLTLRQIKEISEMGSFGNQKEKKHRAIGKKVIIRTYSAGVHYGTLVEKNGIECVLEDAIRIWSWKGAASLSQLAMEGIKKENESECKFAMRIHSIDLQWIEIIPTTILAGASIEGVKSWIK